MVLAAVVAFSLLVTYVVFLYIVVETFACLL